MSCSLVETKAFILCIFSIGIVFDHNKGQVDHVHKRLRKRYLRRRIFSWDRDLEVGTLG